MEEVQVVQRKPIKDASKKPQRFSAKLIELSRWELADEVNSQLDRGRSVRSVHSWIAKHGFKISYIMLIEYAELRKKSIIEGVTMERLLGTVRNPILNINSENKRTVKDKLMSELDALDLVIQKGYENLMNNQEKINAASMMAAIKLKNDLTEGTHGFLTNFGMEHLREIETAKYALIVKHLLSFIPSEKRIQAVRSMAEVEENFYYNTDYYEEYLRTVGDLTEEAIQVKLDKWKSDVLAETKEHMENVQSWRENGYETLRRKKPEQSETIDVE